MADNNSLSQTAKLLYDVDSKTAVASLKEMMALTDGLTVLYGKSLDAARKAGVAFEANKSVDNAKALQVAVGNLGKAIGALKTTGTNVNIFSDNEATKILAIRTEVQRLETALQTIAKNNQIKEGTLGLDSNNLKDKINSIKTLEAAQRSLNLVIQAGQKYDENGATQPGLAAAQARAALINENIRLLKQQAQAIQEAAAAQRGADLNEIGSRNSQYKQVQANQRLALTQMLEERKQFLNARAAQERGAALNESGQRQIDYKRQQGEQERALINQMEQRRQFLKQQEIERNRQAQAFTGFNPNNALRDAFGSTAPQGASTFQRINTPGSVPPEQIEAQKQVLALQNQIVDRMRQNLPLDAQHLALVEQVIAAKARESALNAAHTQQLREEEAAQRRVSLAGGIGGASLLAVQGALRVNSLVMTGLQNALTQALSSAVQVEAAFKNVQAVTATTNVEMEGLGSVIKQTAADTVFSAKEVADGALILGQAGLSAKETAQAIPAVALLATAAGSSLAEAVNLTTSVLGIFDIQASQTADVANKITQAANSSKVSVDKLAQGFQYAGNIAHLSGISFEETTAALSTMSNAGILSGSTLGSGLRAFLTEVQKPSDQFISTLNRVGLSLADVDFKAHGLLGVTTALRQAGFVATDAIKSFDIRGAAAFNALIANPDDLERQYKGLLDTSAAVNANAIQMDSLAAQAKRLQTNLENLAGAGFGPLGQLLKDVAKNTSDFLSSISGASTTLGILGTVLATTAAVATVKFAIGIGAGALQLAGFTEATVLAVRALTTMTVVEALAGSLKLFESAVLAVNAAQRELALAFSLGGLSGFAGALNVAKTAALGLWAALSGVSLLTGVGIAVAAAAAGYYLLSSNSEKAAKALDEATAASNEARGTYEAQSKTVASLDDTINSLTYRQGQLKDGSAELSLAVAEVNNKFGSQTGYIDVNNTSAQSLIETLKNLRKEMVNLSNVDLTVAIEKARTLQEVTSGQARDKVAGIGAGAASSLGRLLSNNTGAFTSGNANTINAASAAIRSGDTGSASGLALANLAPLLRDALKNSTIQLGNADRAELNRILNTLPSVNEALQQNRSASAATGALVSAQTTRAAVEAVKAQRNPLGGSGTVGDFLAPTPALVSGIRANNPNATPVDIYNLTDVEVRRRNEESVKFIAALTANGTKTDTATTQVVQQIRTNMEELNKQRDLSLTNAGPQFKVQDAQDEGAYTARLRLLKKQPKTPGRDSAIEQLENAENERKKNVAKRGVTDPYQLNYIDVKADQANADRIEADQMSKQKQPRQDNIAERTAKLSEQAALSAAASDKALASMLTNFDDVQKLMDDGVKQMGIAGDFARQGLKAQQDKQRKVAEGNGENTGKGSLIQQEFDQQTAALNNELKSKQTEYIASFTALGHAASKQLTQYAIDLKAKQTQLENTKLDNADTLFDAGGKLRDIQLQQASKQFPGQVSPNGSLEQQANQQQLNLASLAIAQNQKVLDQLGDSQTGLIGTQTAALAEIQKELEPLNKRIEDLRARVANASDAERPGLQNDLQGALSNKSLLDGQLKDTTASLRGFRDQKQTLQTTQAGLQVTQEQLIQKIPLEFDTTNLTASLENGLNQWKDSAANLDSVRTLTDGLGGVFTTLQDSTAKSFASILSGTESVKKGFQSMAVSVLTSMLNLATQVAAQQGLKSIFGLLGGLSGGIAGIGGIDSVGAIGEGGLAIPSSVTDVFNFGAASGGYVTPQGTLERVRKFAAGGHVTGGTAGKDSVPALLMPNEFVMNTKAVDAVGTDYLHSLNAGVASSLSSAATAQPASNNQAAGNGTVNVWIVPPATQPQLGPKDIVAAIADDMTRGGQTKKLVKSIQMGG